jgi:hypothetical protein
LIETQALNHHENGLPGHPSDGQHSLALHSVIVFGIECPAHSKVRDFYCVLLSHQTISRRQIPMNHVQSFLDEKEIMENIFRREEAPL